MALSVIRALEDGSTVVRDDADGFEAVLKPGEWEQVRAVRPDQQRGLVERFVLRNRVSGDPRTPAEQEAMETAQNAGTGEAHQDGEERG